MTMDEANRPARFDLPGMVRTRLRQRSARPAGMGDDEVDRRARLQQRRKAAIPAVRSMAELIDVAEKMAAQAEIDQGAADYLFKRSRWPGLSRQQWEKEVRLAGAMFQIVRGSRRDFPWEQQVDVRAVDDAFGRLRSDSDAANGTLLVTFHGPWTPMAQELFKRRCDQGYVLGVRAGDDERENLFAATNALREGRCLLMAPDGRQGRQSRELNVLGTVSTVGGGAAFLAHALRCNTAWYVFVRQGDRFVPVIDKGPTREDGETLAAFSERFHRFYADKLEDVFTGDPRNILLSGAWGRCFARAANERPPPQMAQPVRAQIFAGVTKWLPPRTRPPGMNGKQGANRQAAMATPSVDSAAALFAVAEKLVPNVKIDESAADYLIRRSQCPERSRAEWLHDVRSAAAIQEVMKKSQRSLPWTQLVSPAAVEAAFTQLRAAPNASRGTLLLTFHDPATVLTRMVFRKNCKGGIILQRNDTRDDLFAALNKLRDGGFVLMAPDGPCGQQSAEFKVLGVTHVGGAGAAFLAHASRCNTAWCTFVRNGDRFAPMIELGPARLDGESLATFSERLHRFYEKKIEGIFTGDPRNIKLIGAWARAFARAERGGATAQV